MNHIPPTITKILRRKFIGNFPETLFWNGKDKAKTLLFDAMSLLTPLFEQLVLTSVLSNRHGFSDPLLKQQMHDLLSQETQHRLSYEQLLSQWKTRGLAVDQIQAHQALIMRFCSLFLSKRYLLSLSVATEHWTAILAQVLLSHSHDYLEDQTLLQSTLWLWHAVEEIEHKAVAFDIQKALHIGYLQRVSAMFMVTLLFGYFYWKNILHLIRFHKLSFWKTSCAVFWMWNGKKGLLTRSFLEFLAFFKPNFHPWKNNTTLLLRYWQKKLTRVPYQTHVQ